MENFSLQNVLNKLTVGTKIDSSFEFLNVYDKNKNSIFDAEDIEAIKKDLEEADKRDSQIGTLTKEDLKAFYEQAMKNIISLDSENVLNQIQDCFKLISVGNLSLYSQLKKEESFQKMDKKQQNFAKEILKLPILYKDFDHFDAIYLAEKTPEGKEERTIELLKLRINNEPINAHSLGDILEYDEELQNKAIKIVEENMINTNRIYGVIKLANVYDYFPKDLLKKHPNFCVITGLDGAAGYKLSKDSDETFMYKPEKGLVERIRNIPEKGEIETINLEHKTIHKASYTKYHEEDFLLSETIDKYDNLEYDELINNFKPDNLIETRTLTRKKSGDIPTITIKGLDGEKLLQIVEVLHDGTLHVVKNFTSPSGVTSKIDYNEYKNGSMSMVYKITDKDGTLIMDRNVSIEQEFENQFKTKVNDDEYKIFFNSGYLTITDMSSKTTKKFDISENFITEGKAFILEILERVPANLLMVMDKLPIKSISLDVDNSSKRENNACWRESERFIELGQYEDIIDEINNTNKEYVAEFMLSTFMHEYGHYLDSDVETGLCEAISNNQDLKAIYQEEIEAFGKSSTTQQQKYLSYFVKGISEQRNAQERVAEATMLLNTIPGKSFSVRSVYFQENFPRTIAKINELINERLKSLNK